MAQQSPSQAASAISEYTPRASSYEASNAGWHADLASDFISWVKPTAGETVLDLACGTGLVSFRMAAAVGPTGTVVGVDITPAMLDIARSHFRSHPSSPPPQPTFLEADITSPTLPTLPAISTVLASRGGFDIISCCSALILLDDPTAALQFWTSTLLRPGGRLIVDVPTEQRTVQLLATDVLGPRVGVRFPFGRAWVRDRQSVEAVVDRAGLSVEMLTVTRSYLPEWTLGRGDGEGVFRSDVLAKYGRGYVEKGVVEEARREWVSLWEEEVDAAVDGTLRDGHWLYVCVGRKAG